MSEATNDRWGNYLLVERIGSGGMCEVFRARRLGAADWSKDVCLKRLHRQLCRDAEFIRLFRNEAITGAKLRHRNIVSVEDFGEHQGHHFLAMEFVRGVDLSRLEGRVRETRTFIEPSVGAFILYELLRALEIAQNTADPDTGQPLRVVHRDVSPHNVLVSFNGEVKLSDFGIALAAGRARATLSNTVRGKFGYIPLEQARGQSIDGRADLFSLGVTVFELLTGQRPFCGTHSAPTFELILAAQIANDRPSLSVLRPDLPAPLVQLVEQLLAPLPDDRPRDATRALRALETLPEVHRGGLALPQLMGFLYPNHASVARIAAVDLASEPEDFAPTHKVQTPRTSSFWGWGVVNPPAGQPTASDDTPAPTAGIRRRWHAKSLLVVAALAIASMAAVGAALSRTRRSERLVLSTTTGTPVTAVTVVQKEVPEAWDSPKATALPVVQPVTVGPAAPAAPPDRSTPEVARRVDQGTAPRGRRMVVPSRSAPVGHPAPVLREALSAPIIQQPASIEPEIELR